VMAEAATFSSGLGIFYEPDSVLNIARSSTHSSIQPGQRAPDVSLQKPATFESTRLQTETPNIARFYVVLFAGNVASTKASLAAFSKSVEDMPWLFNSGTISWISIFSGAGGPSAYETLGGMPFGKVFYDEDHSAHKRYGIDVEEGMVFVFRPDGWVGTVSELGSGAADALDKYFKRFLILNGDARL
jgi:phenol 2-monooxygenase